MIMMRVFWGNLFTSSPYYILMMNGIFVVNDDDRITATHTKLFHGSLWWSLMAFIFFGYHHFISYFWGFAII